MNTLHSMSKRPGVKQGKPFPPKIIIVAGMGEVGRPLLEILGRTYECVGIDMAPVQIDRRCAVLHVCYPYQMADFVGTTVRYINKYQPELTIINSTIAIRTTRGVQERVDTPVVYSPVRGKHATMMQDMLRYRKFVAGFNAQSTQQAAQHFAGAGFEVSAFCNAEVGELSKLVETAWLGILIGWAQEVERMAAECGASYEEVNAFIKEINFLPSHVFPGRIGGHCVMPNIAILRDRFSVKFLDAVFESNAAKEEQSARLLPPDKITDERSNQSKAESISPSAKRPTFRKLRPAGRVDVLS